MSPTARRRICSLGFVLGCISLLVLGLPDEAGRAARHMPGWGKAMLFVALMGLLSSVAVLASLAIASRMLQWTRESIARIEPRQG